MTNLDDALTDDAIAHRLAGFDAFTTSPAEAVELFDAARGRCPVAHSDRNDGFHLFLDHAGVRAAAADHTTFSSEPQVLRPVLPRPSLAALEMDLPQHHAWRALFAQAVTPHTVAYLEPLVRADVTRHIDAFAGRGSADLVEELARPVPAEAICRMVGIDDDRRVMEVCASASDMFDAQADHVEFQRRLGHFAGLALREVEDRRRAPREDYLTNLTQAELEGRPISDDDFVSILTGFLGAGHHSSASAIGSLLFEVYSRPDVRAQVEANPDTVIPVAVEEALRLRPPFFAFFRRATKDVTVSGVEIAAGDDVYLSWVAANRDPQVFPAPGEFRLDRGRNRHVSFGVGLHTCPGAALARMELRVVLEEVLRRLPDLQLAPQEPEWVFGGGDFVSLTRLPVTFSPTTPGRVRDDA